MTNRPGADQPAGPIFLVKSPGLAVREILQLLTVEKSFYPAVDCGNLLAGFQLLYRHDGGILAVEIQTKKEYMAFNRALSALIRAINAVTVRILIFTNSNEVLDSRALAQFQFIRCFQLPKQPTRVADVLLRESRNLSQSVQNYERRQTRAQAALTAAPILMIRGSGPESSVQKVPGAAMATKSPLANCVGPEIPTYLYGAELSWRVRGHFSNYDPQQGTIDFTTGSDGAEKKLLGQLKRGPVLLSSSSRPEGKICSALEFVEVNRNDFRFRVPKMTKVIQRRAHQRRRANVQNQALLRWFDPSLRTDRLFSVFDYGAAGVGFLIPKDQQIPLKKGDSVGPVFVYSQGREIEIESVLIRHISKAEFDRHCFLVGVEFQKISARHRSLIEMMVFTGTL